MIPIEDSDTPQEIEKLRERHRMLAEQKITARANWDTSKAALEKLKQQARDSYGTDDLEELRRQLAEMKTENERKRADYQQHLGEIERRLAEVERQHDEVSRKEPQS